MSKEAVSSSKAKPILAAIPLLIAVIALVVSIFLFKQHDFGQRWTYYFYSVDTGEVATEVRYLPRNPIQGEIKLFCDELVLGPMTNRFERVVPLGTRVDFCSLVKDEGSDQNVLYVGLSEDAINKCSSVEELKKGIDLFKVNIVSNFTKINTVKVYIDGKSVWN